jgi:hypothetical protein
MTITKKGVVAIVGLAIAVVGIILAYVWGYTSSAIVAIAASALALGVAVSNFISASSISLWKRWVAALLIVAGFSIAGYTALVSAAVATKIIGYVIAIITFIIGVIAGTVTSSST